jgi:hypothetical protein
MGGYTRFDSERFSEEALLICRLMQNPTGRVVTSLADSPRRKLRIVQSRVHHETPGRARR